MVYHYNNHFRNYSIIEGLMKEKLYVKQGKKLNIIYFFNRFIAEINFSFFAFSI